MTVYTKQWKKEKDALAKAKAQRNKYSKSQAQALSKDKNYTATIKDTSADISTLKKSQDYYWKVDKAGGKDKNKKTTKKWVKRKKPRKLTKQEQANLASWQKQHDAAQASQKKLRATASYKNAAAKRKKAQEKLNSATTKLNKLKQKRHKQALSRIAKQRQQNAERFMAPHAHIHATNSMTGLTVFLFAQTEDEDNESDATTYPIDQDDPVVDHVRRSGKTITVTGFLYGQSAGKKLWSKATASETGVSNSGLPKKSTQQQYRDLLKWQFAGTELVYKSDYTDTADMKMQHIYYKHLFMTGLTKTLGHPYSDMVQISMTFQFAYKAKVKSSTNSKGKKGAKGHYVGAKKIKVKKGMTYASVAKKQGVYVKQLEKWNGSAKKAMKVGKRIQVSSGVYQAKSKGSTGYSYKHLAGDNSSIIKKINKQLRKK